MRGGYVKKNRKEVLREKEPLRFGTSGLRDLVEAMTDMECYINTRGFIRFLKQKGEAVTGSPVAVGGDRRASTPRIVSAVIEAVRDEGNKPVYAGLVPSPVLANFALRSGMSSVMVTGSHIPEDRNGIKFTKTTGEVLKSDEKDILGNISSFRQEEYSKPWDVSAFDENGMFKVKKELPEPSNEPESMYVKRYLDVFPPDALKGKRIVFYQHSAVGRDIIEKIFSGMGAEVVCVGRSESFVPVDTEKISEKTGAIFEEAVREFRPFAVISTDGDSDRPLFSDENGRILPGDKLGALVSMYLKPDFAAIPVSANPAVVKALASEGIEISQTRIGSPYVIEAMNLKLARDPGAKVVSWESNGGFLTGSEWKLFGETLRALPTRDAVLPLLSAILLAINDGASISEIIDRRMPGFYTSAGVVDDTDKGLELYDADMGKKIIEMFSPGSPGITSAEFSLDGENVSVSEISGDAPPKRAEEEVLSIRRHLLKYFNTERGFGDLVAINFVDGIRMTFRAPDGKEEISHLRPSGNAPEFRNYAAAETEARAREIAELRYDIVPEIVKEVIRTFGGDRCGK